MLGFGLGLSLLGVLVALLAIMVVFMGNESAFVPALLGTLLAGLPITALTAGAALRDSRLDGLVAALRASPSWLYVALGVLVAVLGIAVLALWMAAHVSGESLPARFHVPVIALAAYIAGLAVFAGLIAESRSAGADAGAGGDPS